MKHNAALYLLLLLNLASCSRSMGPSIMQMPEPSPVVPDIGLQHTYFATEDSLYFYFLLEDRRGIMEVQKTALQLTYKVNPGKEEKEVPILADTVKFTARRVVDVEDGFYTSVVLPGDIVQAPRVLHVQLWQQLGKVERMGSLFQIPLNAAMLEKQHVLVDANTNMPVIRKYVTTTSKLKILSATDSSYSVVEFMGTEFPPALPPMSLRPEQQTRTLQVADSLTVRAGDTIQFEKEGLYLLWPGQPYAQALVVQPWSYPDVTMARELISPLIYITTSEEREKLSRAEDPKKAVDIFWQEVGGNTTTARELIRLFYGRVETANKLYTSHKAGWATDRGMIHVIFGRPDDIARVGSNETWTYGQTRTRPYIKFVFTKKQNNFTENHYELVRLRDYREVWYSTVAKWRAGITEI